MKKIFSESKFYNALFLPAALFIACTFLSDGAFSRLFAAEGYAESRMQSYYYAGRHEPAVEYLDSILAAEPGNVKLWLLKGHILRQTGDVKKAGKAYSSALAISRDDKTANYYYAFCNFLSGNNAAAGEALDKYFKASPDASRDRDMVYLKGMIELESKKFKAAAGTFSGLLSSFPDFSPYLISAAMAFEGCGMKNEAHDSYIDAFKFDPANVEMLYASAPFMARVGDMKNAYKYYRTLLNKFKNDESVKRAYEKAASAYGAIRQSGDGNEKAPEPLKVEPLKLSASDRREILVGLNTKSDGSPVEMSSVMFKSSGNFVVLSNNTQKQLFDGSPGKYYELLMKRGKYEIRNTQTGKSFELGGGRLVIKNVSDSDTIMFRGIKVASGMAWEGSEARSYRGSFIAVSFQSGRFFHVINRIRLEEYLLSVLPSEMPSDYPLDALVAQAVCARSEVMHKKSYIKKHSKYGYDVCDDQDCQMYRGVSWETPRCAEAVVKSAGLVLTYNSRVCDAIYSDNCGGYTQSSSDITGWGNIAYLSSTPDIKAAGRDISKICCPLYFEEFIRNNDAAYCKPAGRIRNYESRWIRKIEARHINECLKKYEIGRIVRMIPRKRSVSGHIDTLELVGTRGRKTINGELAIRRMIGYSPLRSSKFIVETACDGDGSPKYFIFAGAGFGHGVGMCQNGAYGMAEEGMDYRKILGHYFKGASISKL